MTIKTAVAESTDPAAIVAALTSALAAGEPKFVLYFLSTAFDPTMVASLVREAFPAATSVGCTTAGELVDERMLSGGLVACALYDDDLEAVHATHIDNPGDPDAVSAALGRLESGMGSLAADPERTLGIVLQDGMRGTEEVVMQSLSTLCNVPFVGGSAGDDRAFERTHTCVDGTAKEGAAALVALRLRRPFSILKTQSFDVTDTALEATDVDEVTRTVRAFDGRPAAQAYAEALSIPVEALPTRFMRNPLGLVMSDGTPYVRSPQRVVGSDVVFYCSVKQGMRLHVLSSRDIVEDTRSDLARAIDALGGCSGVINFHCILRTVELQAKSQCEAYGALFAGIPMVGFSTYGESYIGHINQTSTMVLLK